MSGVLHPKLQLIITRDLEDDVIHVVDDGVRAHDDRGYADRLAHYERAGGAADDRADDRAGSEDVEGGRDSVDGVDRDGNDRDTVRAVDDAGDDVGDDVGDDDVPTRILALRRPANDVGDADDLDAADTDADTDDADADADAADDDADDADDGPAEADERSKRIHAWMRERVPRMQH